MRITPSRILLAGLLAALCAALALGVVQVAGRSGGSRATPLEVLTGTQQQRLLAGSPTTLAALHAQGGELLSGGTRAWQAQLHALAGLPLVVNKWASWCVPCQGERLLLQHAAARRGTRVAFLGLDSGDSSRGDALAFLSGAPPSYPSYYDPTGALGRAVTDSSFTPVTVFYNRAGGHYIHQGPYQSLAALERDIARYALRAGTGAGAGAGA